MNQKKVSVHGLQNIGMLLGRADAPKEAPKRERGTKDDIESATLEKIHAAVGPAVTMSSQMSLVRSFVKAAVRNAYNLGHAEALEQNSSVERLLEKQYEARTRVTTPAVVCAIMEQSGLSSMTLDMAQLATVFQRCDIQYTYDPDTEVMEYTMRPAGVFTEGPLAVPFKEHPEEIDPRDDHFGFKRTDESDDHVGIFDDPHLLEDDLDPSRQLEDIEQSTRDAPLADDDGYAQ